MSTDYASQIDAVRQIDQEMADLAVRERSYVSAVAEQSAADQAALADWEQQRDAALAAGKIPPDPPLSTLPGTVHRDAVATYAAQRRTLTDRRRRAVGQAAEQIAESARADIDKARDKAQRHADALAGLAREIESARRQTADAHMAADESNGVRRDPARADFTAHDLLAARDDDDLLAGLGSERPLGFVEWSAPNGNAPEPSDADRQARLHPARTRPVGRRGY